MASTFLNISNFKGILKGIWVDSTTTDGHGYWTIDGTDFQGLYRPSTQGTSIDVYADLNRNGTIDINDKVVGSATFATTNSGGRGTWTWDATQKRGDYFGTNGQDVGDTFISNLDFLSTGVKLDALLTVRFSSQPKEGAGVFTTSINLSAGTQSTGNLAEGATVYWKVTGITGDDLASGQLSGSGTISSGKLDLQHSLKRDSDTAESFEVSIFSDAGMTQQIGDTVSHAVLEGPKVVARGNSLYAIVDGPSWTQAEANAVKLGGHLVTINDASENQWIVDEFEALEGKPNVSPVAPNAGNWNGIYYIGINDIAVDGHLEWISGGDIVDFVNWGEYGDYSWADAGYGNRNIGMISLHDGFAPWMRSGKWGMGVEAEFIDRSGVDEVQGIAEIPFIRRGDSAYVIVQGPTWEEAEKNAQALGGHLVTIDDAGENEWLWTQFRLSATDGIWLGATDKHREGEWEWADGTPWSFSNWESAQPDNATHYGSTTGENYLQFVSQWNGKWNDIANEINTSEIAPGFPHTTRIGIAEIKLGDLGLDTTFYRSDTTPPTLQSTTASNNQLILTFSEDIQIAGGGALNPAYMTITVDGHVRKITRSQITAPDQPSIHTASKLALTLSGRSLDRASSISISYNPPTNGSNQDRKSVV